MKVPPEKLSIRQRRVIRFNHCLVLALSRKGDKCRTLLVQLQKEYPESELPVLILAYLHYRDNQYPQALKVLQEFVESHDRKMGLPAQLTCAHLLLLKNDKSGAIKALKETKEIANRPAVIATLVALHEELGQVDEALKTIEDAVSYYTDLKKAGDNDPTTGASRSDMIQKLVAKSASLAHRYQRYQQAFNSYERLYLETKDEEAKRRYLARVVMAASKVDSKTAAKYASKLGTMPGIDQINVKILESQPPPTTKTKEEKKDGKDSDGDVKMKERDETKEKAREERLKLRKAKRQAKKRKKRTPKNIDPSVPLDPERWLPKWERSTFKKR